MKKDIKYPTTCKYNLVNIFAFSFFIHEIAKLMQKFVVRFWPQKKISVNLK